MLLIIAVKRMIYVIKHYCLGRVSVDCEVLFCFWIRYESVLCYRYFVSCAMGYRY